MTTSEFLFAKALGSFIQRMHLHDNIYFNNGKDWSDDTRQKQVKGTWAQNLLPEM